MNENSGEKSKKPADNSKSLIKERDLTSTEISEKAKELGIEKTYLDYAKMIERSDGSTEIKFEMNNFWIKFLELNETEEEFEDDEIVSGIWKKFKEEEKELFSKLENLTKENHILYKNYFSEINKNSSEEIIEEVYKKFSENFKESYKFYEEAYLYLAKKGIPCKELRS